MRSARRQALLEKKSRSVKKSNLFLKILLPILAIVGLLVFIKISVRHWDGSGKFSLTYRLEDGSVAVSVFDPKMSEATVIIIPANTQVEVARNYGEIRIKNVWQLGVNEKIKGNLLAETITQNFLFPVFLWSDSDAKALSNGNAIDILHFIFFPRSTNITFGDRLSVGIFALNIRESNRNNIDLGKSQFLVKQKLSDGQPGYVATGSISPRLTVYFTDTSFISDGDSGQSLRVAIEDATGKPGVAEKVGQLIEVMGGKVVSVDKKTSTNTDCNVYGSNARAVEKVANLFACKITANSGNFDLGINLGQGFSRRF